MHDKLQAVDIWVAMFAIYSPETFPRYRLDQNTRIHTG